jgi:hypothetical protein
MLMSCIVGVSVEPFKAREPDRERPEAKPREDIPPAPPVPVA